MYIISEVCHTLLGKSRIVDVSRSIIEAPSAYSRNVPVKTRPGVRSISYALYRTIRLLKIDFGM